jgi:hypothetical protein
MPNAKQALLKGLAQAMRSKNRFAEANLQKMLAWLHIEMQEFPTAIAHIAQCELLEDAMDRTDETPVERRLRYLRYGTVHLRQGMSAKAVPWFGRAYGVETPFETWSKWRKVALFIGGYAAAFFPPLLGLTVVELRTTEWFSRIADVFRILTAALAHSLIRCLRLGGLAHRLRALSVVRRSAWRVLEKRLHGLANRRLYRFLLLLVVATFIYATLLALYKH